MPEIYRAADVNEAVEIADRLKEIGEYDWFRGQVQAWPPHSSLFRVYRTENEDWIAFTLSRIEKFGRWVMGTPGLEAIAKNRDALFAVAQHYGIPTNYIDFTTDPGVAGFFACDTKQAPKPGTESCIYCLSTEDIRDIWRFVQVHGRPEIELIKLDVSGLWRLEAQKGTFLFCPMNWDIDYPMDRIVFPYKGYPSYPVAADVYPDQKSSLEIILDQYFAAERSTNGYLRLKDQLARMAVAGAPIEGAEMVAPTGGYQTECVRGRITELDSWKPEALERWLAVSDQGFEEANCREIRLAVDLSAPASDLRRAFTYATRRALGRNDKLREGAIAFQNTSGGQLDAGLQASLQWLWNGLRVLPYENEDIAEAVGSCVFLHQTGLHRTTASAESRHIASLCFGYSIQVEFGAPDGSDSRGWVNASELRGIVRSDIEDLIEPRYRGQCADAEFLLQAIPNPRYLFEFMPLARLFARQIVPTQVLERKGFAAFFSPARLGVLSLP